jgi:hypothetical protein
VELSIQLRVELVIPRSEYASPTGSLPVRRRDRWRDLRRVFDKIVGKVSDAVLSWAWWAQLCHAAVAGARSTANATHDQI